MLYGGNATVDPYKTAVIDTIVAEVQSVPGEDRCVLLLGYKEQMEEMFQVCKVVCSQNLAHHALERKSRTVKTVCYRKCISL